MYTGSLAPVSRREDWIAVSPLVAEDGTNTTLTGATFKMFICEQGSPDSALLSGSTADGKITLPTTTTFQWTFTPDQMAVLPAGTYAVFLRVTISSVTTQILSCTVQILEGGPA